MRGYKRLRYIRLYKTELDYFRLDCMFVRKLPFHCNCQSDEERYRISDVVKGVDDLRPDVDVDGGRVGDQLEALLQAVLQHREADEDGIENAKHHDQLRKTTKMSNKSKMSKNVKNIENVENIKNVENI